LQWPAGLAIGEFGCTSSTRVSRPQNAYIESFNGRLRDECLNENEFRSLSHARLIIEDWRRDYNEFRPHKSLGNRTPEEFVRGLQTTPTLHLSAA
jgi:transposase InsO family protein